MYDFSGLKKRKGIQSRGNGMRRGEAKRLSILGRVKNPILLKYRIVGACVLWVRGLRLNRVGQIMKGLEWCVCVCVVLAHTSHTHGSSW